MLNAAPMDPTATTTPSRYPRPVPVAIRADGLGTLPHLLNLVRMALAHGKEFLATLHQRATDPDFPTAARAFGSSDLGIIAACLQRGILRATALCAMLARREARGLDLPYIPMPLPHAPGSGGAPRPGPAGWWHTSALGYMPTQAEVEDEVRHRAIGPLLAEICLDLGIWRDTDRELWSDLNTSMAQCCSTISSPLFGEMMIRVRGFDEALVTKTATSQRWRAAVRAAAAAAEASQPPATLPPAPEPFPPEQRAAERRPPGSAPRAAAGRAARSIPFETAPTMHWPVNPPYVEKIAATGAS